MSKSTYYTNIVLHVFVLLFLILVRPITNEFNPGFPLMALGLTTPMLPYFIKMLIVGHTRRAEPQFLYVTVQFLMSLVMFFVAMFCSVSVSLMLAAPMLVYMAIWLTFYEVYNPHKNPDIDYSI